MALRFPPPPARQQLPRHGDRHVLAVSGAQRIEDHWHVKGSEVVGDQQ